MMHPKSAFRALLEAVGEPAVFEREGVVHSCIVCILPRAYGHQLVSDDRLSRFGRADGRTFVLYAQADGAGALLEDGELVGWGGKRYLIRGLHEYRFGGEVLYRRAAARLVEEDADESLYRAEG